MGVCHSTGIMLLREKLFKIHSKRADAHARKAHDVRRSQKGFSKSNSCAEKRTAVSANSGGNFGKVRRAFNCVVPGEGACDDFGILQGGVVHGYSFKRIGRGTWPKEGHKLE